MPTCHLTSISSPECGKRMQVLDHSCSSSLYHSDHSGCCSSVLITNKLKTCKPLAHLLNCTLWCCHTNYTLWSLVSEQLSTTSCHISCHNNRKYWTPTSQSQRARCWQRNAATPPAQPHPHPARTPSIHTIHTLHPDHTSLPITRCRMAHRWQPLARNAQPSIPTSHNTPTQVAATF